METSEFLPIFSKFKALKNRYKGAFSCDTTLRSLKINEFFICNTDTRYGFGQHWLCVHKPTKDSIEIFNSLGSDSQAKELYTTIGLKLGVAKINHNLTQVQSSGTTTCGQFCVFFLVNRLYNLDIDFEELLNDLFQENLNENEHKVATFFEELDLLA